MDVIFYGACGVEQCLDCRPIFDKDDNEIPDTDTSFLNRDELWGVVSKYLGCAHLPCPDER